MSFNSSPVIGKAMKSENLTLVSSATSNERKTCDAVKSLLTLLKDWDEYHQSGKMLLATISKLKESMGWKVDNLPASPKIDALMEACFNLGTVLDRLAEVAHDIKTLAQQVVVLSNLQQFQSQKTAKIPVFPSGTWDCTKFGAVFEDISEVFHQDIKLLTFIKESAAQAPDRSTLTSYIAMWNNLTCSNTRSILLINGLLIESSLCAM